jgi:hypothetical protein
LRNARRLQDVHARLQVAETGKVTGGRRDPQGPRIRRGQGLHTTAKNPYPHLIHHEDFQFLLGPFAETENDLVSIAFFGINAVVFELVKGTTKMKVCRAIQIATDEVFIFDGPSDRLTAVVRGVVVPFDGLSGLYSVSVCIPMQVWHLCRAC